MFTSLPMRSRFEKNERWRVGKDVDNVFGFYFNINIYQADMLRAVQWNCNYSRASIFMLPFRKWHSSWIFVFSAFGQTFSHSPGTQGYKSTKLLSFCLCFSDGAAGCKCVNPVIEKNISCTSALWRRQEGLHASNWEMLAPIKGGRLGLMASYFQCASL